VSHEHPRRDPADALLDELLARAPRHAAPAALRRRLSVLLGSAPEEVRPRRRWHAALAPALAAGVVLVAGGVVLERDVRAPTSLASEAVHDHLRVLARQAPPDVASGGSHQVKPWFEGKLDFAPEVPAPPGGPVWLRGGSIGYVFDRKAAVLEYDLRGHAATLLVFPAEGLRWPGSGPVASQTGFNVVLWRTGELGYALVSDVPAPELAQAAAVLRGGADRAPP
jgi:anti-sigma factor RsiW